MFLILVEDVAMNYYNELYYLLFNSNKSETFNKNFPSKQYAVTICLCLMLPNPSSPQ